MASELATLQRTWQAAWCVCVSARHSGKDPGVQVACCWEQDDWLRARRLVLHCCVYNLNAARRVATRRRRRCAIRFCAASVESVLPRAHATGGRKTRWCKFGASRGSGMIGGVRASFCRVVVSIVCRALGSHMMSAMSLRHAVLRCLAGKCVPARPRHGGRRKAR